MNNEIDIISNKISKVTNFIRKNYFEKYDINNTSSHVLCSKGKKEFSIRFHINNEFDSILEEDLKKCPMLKMDCKIDYNVSEGKHVLRIFSNFDSLEKALTKFKRTEDSLKRIKKFNL